MGYQAAAKATEQPQDFLHLAKSDRPPWSGDRLLSMPRANYSLLKNFLRRRHRSCHGVATFKDIDRFVALDGDRHVDWDSLLRICEKADDLEPRHWNPAFWMEASLKQGLSFVALDQSLLVSRGLYKAALARYALHTWDCDTLYGVKVSRWSVDWRMYETWLKLTGICAKRFPHLTLAPAKDVLVRSHHGQWMAEDYRLTLRREDKQTGQISFMTGNDAGNWLQELEVDTKTPRFTLSHLKAHALAA